MARFSFGIFGQGSGDLQPDLAVEMKQSNTVKASTAPTGDELSITDNGDGTYFVDALPSGNYDIYVAGALQDEMTNQLVLQEDVVTHMNDATKHRLIQDDGTGSTAGNGNTTTLWSGNQIHDWTHQNFETADSTIMKEGEVDGTSLQYSGTLKIKDGGVTEAKIGSGAVTSGKIGTDAITNAKMANNSVNSDEIVNDAVITAKIIDGAVTQDKIADNAINMNKMTHHSGYGVLTYNQSGVPEVGQLTSSHIQANTVTESLINNNAVTTDKINNSAVTEAKIGTGAVTNGKIGSSAVDTAQLATSAVETVNINAGAVTEAKISDDAVGHEKMKHHTDYGVMKYSSSGVPSVGTITGNHIALGTVTSGNIMNGAVGTTQLADNSVTSAKLSGVSLTVSDDSIDQTKVKFVAGNGSAGGQGDFSAGTTPSFLSYASGDDIQLQGLSFFQGDFDTSTNLDDNNLKMQQVKIKQTFTSENYISSTKTLNQNMDILDQRLGYITQFSGTEGLYMVLASGTYNWNASRNGNGTLQTVTNAVMDLPKVTDGTETNQTWYSVQMASIYKVPDVRQFALYARGQVSSVLNGFKGYARIRVEGDNFSSVNQEGGAYDSTSSALKAVYKDATTLQNYKIYNVWVDIKFNNFGVSGTKNFELGDWCLVAKRQITAVGGETNVADDSPL